ncbi:hypothetical protein ACM64Y_05675 [Novispirillum sp. DQ9]|uniref:hypothetical protein n=1 Tax=Novispirillum sp. DQ9 TaxID=3398612 RepID=UPI003C7D6D57
MSGHAPKNDPRPAKPRDKDRKTEEEEEEDLDDALEDTFPASDPIAPQDPGRPGKA